MSERTLVADQIGLTPEDRKNPYATAIAVMNECWLDGWSRDDTAFELVTTMSTHYVPPHHAVYDTRTHVVVPIERIDRYHMDAVLATDMGGTERFEALALNIEEWFGEIIEQFRAQNPDYVPELDRPAVVVSEATND